MVYQVKEIYFTLQGEGAQAGRAAVFLRFAGCNLWNGIERDRAQAICRFCDTDFVGTDGSGGGKFASARDLAAAVARGWPAGTGGNALVVCTGGEPSLQLDEALIAALHLEGLEIAIETNGTTLLPPGIDWICVSPKADTYIAQPFGDELKLVYPQMGVDPSRFEAMSFDHYFLQPMDGPNRAENTELATRYCLEHPRWRLSLQTHKLIGIP